MSDLHVSYPENRALVEAMRPRSPGDWLLVVGDVGERFSDIEWALELLADRYATVVWAPGNHDLWTVRADPVRLRGEARYQHLVQTCRRLGVLTPQDPYPVWEGEGGPATVAPLFVGYDYSFLPDEAAASQRAARADQREEVVCADEFLLHTDPYENMRAWCAARVEYTEQRLSQCDASLPTVLANHYPLVQAPTRVLWYPEFAKWCGTERTADWHVRFRALAVVYGHLHIPRTTWHDGVRFEEVSLGYPREWRARDGAPRPVRQILPATGSAR